MLSRATLWQFDSFPCNKMQSLYIFPVVVNRTIAPEAVSPELLQDVLESPLWQRNFRSSVPSRTSPKFLSSPGGAPGTFTLRSLVAIRNERVFYWNPETQALLTSNLHDSEVDKLTSVQCDISPLFEINRISVSPQGLSLALIGNRGVSILDVGTEDFISDSEQVARCIAISERFFLNNSKTIVHQFEWFPFRETHIIFLTSDNCLRVYLISSPSQPELVINLQGSSTKHSFHNFTAFTLAQSASEKSRDLLASSSPQKRSATVSVYALRSDGNVYTFDLTAGNERCASSALRGPLSEHGSRTSGSDIAQIASSIVYIDGFLPVLLIGTNNEKIIHGIIVEKDDIDIDAQTPLAGFLPSSQELIVLETLELVRPQNTAKNERTHPSQCGILLTNSIGNESFRQSTVQSILSLDPFDTTSSLAVIGAQLICTDANDCSLFTVASNGQVTVQKLWHYGSVLSDVGMGAAGSILSDNDGDKTERRSKPSNEVSFYEYVQTLLSREKSLSLFNFANPEQISAEDLNHIVSRSLAVYEQEYLAKQSYAFEEIQQRQIRLKARRKDLRSMIESMERKVSDLTRELHDFSNLSDFIEMDIMETQNRITHLQTELSQCNPTLTDAELQLLQDVNSLESQISSIDELLDTVEEKLTYKARQTSSNEAESGKQLLSSSAERDTLHGQVINELCRIQTLRRRMDALMHKLSL